MCYNINFLNKKVIASFSGDVTERQIQNAFIDIIENSDIKNIKSIIFDYTNITSYTVPDNFVDIVKAFTRFSVSWNSNINAIAVATNENIKKVNKELKNHKNELIWNYMLFNKLNDALKWCDKNE